MSSERINITLPAPLVERLAPYRGLINVSSICAIALAVELDRIERNLAADGLTAETIALITAKVEKAVKP